MKKIIPIALFLITIITASLNADHNAGKVTCADGTKKEIMQVPYDCDRGGNCENAKSACEKHGGLKPGSWPTDCNQC